MNDYKKNGYIVIKDVLTDSEVTMFRSVMDQYLDNHPSFSEDSVSKILPGFAGNFPDLGQVNNLHQDSRINKALNDYVFEGDNFIYAGHSDLHQNKTTGWHRDTLDYLAKDRGNGTEEGLWSDDCHIVKVCFLLQDHTDNDYGLWFKAGTHRRGVKNTPIILHSRATDMIIFDQRIEHAGQTNKPQYHEKYNRNRYLLTYAFGLDNAHTKIHTKGATLRQNRQNINLK